METPSTAWAIVAIDPGVTTGIARALVDERQPTVAATIRRARMKGNIQLSEVKGTYTKQVVQIKADLDDWFFKVHVEKQLVCANRFAVAIEGFDLRTLAADVTPLEIKAGLECLVEAGYRSLDEMDSKTRFWAVQTASEAKGFCSDDMLKRWGFWKGYSTHHRDAIRHLAKRIDKLLGS